MRTTYMAKPSTVERKWYIIDAAGKTVGRLASEVASILRGKHKPDFTPGVDNGDFVILVNAEKVVFTGKKLQNKIYYTHSLYPGGLKQTTAATMLATKPERVLYNAVKGMLPHNSLGRKQLTKLRVYAGTEHSHAAQNPTVWETK
ncbi:50S ribosomal protein L13 [Tumebacillus permanentifrigoris]|jgi:large subunit ribosomal protein L13|uniref:Large ribosomal subunit protein uL13 n=1 Tax=Tumebacillus permanentifrigoris TaxID=378543 RepID=A0A316D5P1_9BACL|nr:50S ribosomal protein L13 [Tumebacillus permanentifrigoris]PWK05704.1 large subunit ribosomal protein L13 [Tumebacillus permanentifrigoris]